VPVNTENARSGAFKQTFLLNWGWAWSGGRRDLNRSWAWSRGRRDHNRSWARSGGRRDLNRSWARSGGRRDYNWSYVCRAQDACCHRELHTTHDAALVAWPNTTVAAARAACSTGEVIPEGIRTTSATRSNANISAARSTWVAPELSAFAVEATLRFLRALHRRVLEARFQLAALVSRGCTGIATASASCAADEIIPEFVLATPTACAHANVATTLAAAAWEGLLKAVSARRRSLCQDAVFQRQERRLLNRAVLTCAHLRGCKARSHSNESNDVLPASHGMGSRRL